MRTFIRYKDLLLKSRVVRQNRFTELDVKNRESSSDRSKVTPKRIFLLLLLAGVFLNPTIVLSRPTWRITTTEAEAEVHELEVLLYPAHGITIMLTEINMRAIDVFLDDDRWIELQFSPPLCQPQQQCNSRGAAIIRLKQKKDIYQFCDRNNNSIQVSVPPPQGVGTMPSETPASLECNPNPNSPDYTTRLTIVAQSLDDNSIKVFTLIVRPIFEVAAPSGSLSKLKIVPELEKILPTVHLHHEDDDRASSQNNN